MKINEFSQLMFGLSKTLPKWAPSFQDEGTIHSWYTQFQEIDFEELKRACRLAINTLEEFPSVKKLKDLCRGNILTDEQVGQDIANKIGECIGVFGGYSPGAARQTIGELGWIVVMRHGGWWDLCNIESDTALEFLKKEMKKTATNVYQNYRVFGKEKTIGIPDKIDYESNPLLQQALRIVKGVK